MKQNETGSAAGSKRRPKKILLSLLITAVAGLLIYYMQLPALNFHNSAIYYFIGALCLIYMFCIAVMSGLGPNRAPGEYVKFMKSQTKVAGLILLALAATAVVGSVLSAPILRAGSYRELIAVQNGDFTTDVEEISYSRIPMVDADSARQLGDRKLGELADMVSQFEVPNEYSQITYQGRPVRIAPLMYGDVIKWFNNREKGLPAYILVDMVSQEVTVTRLENGIRYSPSELFNRKLIRHLRFTYPTYLFDAPHLEIDDDGHPYWICPRIVKTIGLFGGTDINGAVIMDAVTGACVYYPADQIPIWVDKIYNATLIKQQYDYYGKLKNGFLNSIFGQKGVTVTTGGYNYIAMNNGVYVYTGVTSVGQDQSNVGFILSSQRTKETKYYVIAGATEQSAMASAEGVVQHLHYSATFPLLFNIGGQPTYFMALKDDASLVKMYAMVNVQQYQLVATGTTVAACEQAYTRLLSQNDLDPSRNTAAETSKEGILAEIRVAVLDGTSWYYLRFQGEGAYYAVPATSNPLAILLNAGDTVSLSFDSKDNGGIFSVYSISRVKTAGGSPVASAAPSPHPTVSVTAAPSAPPGT